MTEVPICVSIVRSILPKGGKSLTGTKASRVKRKVKVALEKAGYDVETVRGIGIKFSHYGLKYREQDHHLFGDFCGINEMPTKAARSGRKGSRTKRPSPLITGYHAATADLSDLEFVQKVTKELPDNWIQQKPENTRWMTFDISITRKTGRSPSQVASYIIGQANEHQDLWGEVNFTTFNINKSVILGVGPV